MADHTPYTHGSFCYNELTTSDAAACKDFYTQLLGWTAHPCEVGGMNYMMFKVGDKDVCGMAQMTPEWGDPLPPPHWMAYIAVDDVDALAARVESLGGRTCVPPTDIPTVGRFSVITDPSGATFSVITLLHE